VPEFCPDNLPNDWFSHSEQERYLAMVQKHLLRLMAGRPYRNLLVLSGCVVLAKVVGSRRFNHSGIVTVWPRAVHAVFAGVREVDLNQDPMWSGREIEIYDRWQGEAMSEDTVALRLALGMESA